ncbi:MAG TPA: hypothetical protein VJT31_02715 [Rugosimonospora sp.]|nr:hypothetical protein [Rugosimonospora sp.]
MTHPPPLFDLPDDERLPPDVRTLHSLIRGLNTLREAVEDLAGQHADLARKVQARGEDAVPGVLRWADLDRDTAERMWAWLIDWVGWAVHHFELQEEIPPCWPRHWPLVEELTGLCAAWHVSTDADATAEAPLRWLEALHRARPRLRDWDHTKCRNGTHAPFRAELTWPQHWRDDAVRWARADCASRPTTPAPEGADATSPPAPPAGGRHTTGGST